MKKSILMITLAMVFGLFCNTSLWAGNGSAMKDGSMLSFSDLEHFTITGTVLETGVSGLTIDNPVIEPVGDATLADDVIIDNTVVVYGMGSLSYWATQEDDKPVINENVAIDAVQVFFSNEVRLIAVSISIEGGEAVLLRLEDGTPAWRGIKKLKGTNGTGDCTACPNSGTCGQSQGGGTGTCPLVD